MSGPRVVRAVEKPGKHDSNVPCQAQPPTSLEESAAGLAEDPIDVTRDGARLRGVVARPSGASGPTPLVVVIAGSGPVDRDGNGAVLGLFTDAYKQIAVALARSGVATLRYDKRGVGESTILDPSRVVLADFVEDARAVLMVARDSGRFSSVSVLGHSEGGVIALALAQTTEVDGLLLVATPGRPLAKVVREQLARQVGTETLQLFDEALANARVGRLTGDLPAVLRPLFNPAVLPFVRSLFDLDPSTLVATAMAKRIAVIQGDSDVQLSVDDDARSLAAADPRVTLTILEGMAHTLKTEAGRSLPQRSYTDSSSPLAPMLLGAILAAIP